MCNVCTESMIIDVDRLKLFKLSEIVIKFHLDQYNCFWNRFVGHVLKQFAVKLTKSTGINFYHPRQAIWSVFKGAMTACTHKIKHHSLTHVTTQYSHCVILKRISFSADYYSTMSGDTHSKHERVTGHLLCRWQYGQVSEKSSTSHAEHKIL